MPSPYSPSHRGGGHIFSFVPGSVSKPRFRTSFIFVSRCEAAHTSPPRWVAPPCLAHLGLARQEPPPPYGAGRPLRREHPRSAEVRDSLRRCVAPPGRGEVLRPPLLTPLGSPRFVTSFLRSDKGGRYPPLNPPTKGGSAPLTPAIMQSPRYGDWMGEGMPRSAPLRSARLCSAKKKIIKEREYKEIKR